MLGFMFLSAVIGGIAAIFVAGAKLFQKDTLAQQILSGALSGLMIGLIVWVFTLKAGKLIANYDELCGIIHPDNASGVFLVHAGRAHERLCDYAH